MRLLGASNKGHIGTAMASMSHAKGFDVLSLNSDLFCGCTSCGESIVILHLQMRRQIHCASSKGQGI